MPTETDEIVVLGVHHRPPGEATNVQVVEDEQEVTYANALAEAVSEGIIEPALPVEVPVVVRPVTGTATPLGLSYGHIIFMDEHGLFFWDGSRARQDHLGYHGNELSAIHETTADGVTLHHTPYPGYDPKEYTAAVAAGLIESGFPTDSYLWMGSGVPTARCSNVISVGTQTEGLIRLVRHDRAFTCVSGKRMEYKSIRDGVRAGKSFFVRETNNVARKIKELRGSVDYYRNNLTTAKLQDERKRRAEDVLNKLPESERNALMDVMRFNVQSGNLAQVSRNLSEHERYLKQEEENLKTLIPPKKLLKKDLVTRLGAVEKFCNAYTTRRKFEYVFEYKDELVLKKAGGESISYGKPIITIRFTAGRGGMQISKLTGHSKTKKKFVHPHLHENRSFCLGTFVPHIQKAFATASFYEMSMLLWDYLNKYNPDSPLVDWDTCSREMADA